MAERKAVNKYYPPDWDPRKGSVNKRVGQHPLRDRARKLSQGILVIRFELPYNIWCGGCGSHVGMGVRYNAEKSKVGNYYSTPIYKFRMKCHLCDNYFEIQTDPKNHDYVILNGARRKEQRWDPTENGQIQTEDKATQKKLATDPMYKLEHGSDDTQKGKQQVSNLAELEETRISMVDDYLLNRMARDKFRSEKKQLREIAEAEKAILDKSSLDIELVEEKEEDKKLAALLKYSVTTSFEDKQKEIRKNIEQRPLFHNDKNPSRSSSSSSSSVNVNERLPYQRHAPVKLSRRGEIKQKLGWAIKASYKDPFKVEKEKFSNPLPLSSTSTTVQKQLGIKLKQNTSHSGSDKQNFSNSCNDKQHASHGNNDKQSSGHSTHTAQNFSSKTKPQTSALPIISPVTVQHTPANTEEERNDNKHKEKGEHQCSDKQRHSSHCTNNTLPVSPTNSLLDSSPYSSERLGEVEETDNERLCQSEANETDCVSPASTSHSNSGLLTLINSYNDSDTDSNS